MRQVSVSWEQSACAASARCWVAKGHAHLNWVQEGSCVMRVLLGSLSVHGMKSSQLQHHERGLQLCFLFFTHPSTLLSQGSVYCETSKHPGWAENRAVDSHSFLPGILRDACPFWVFLPLTTSGRTSKHILRPPTLLWPTLILDF